MNHDLSWMNKVTSSSTENVSTTENQTMDETNDDLQYTQENGFINYTFKNQLSSLHNISMYLFYF